MLGSRRWIVASLACVALAPFVELARAAEPLAVSLRGDGADVEARVGDELFTKLDHALGPKPILYPIIGPTGRPMTRDFPMRKIEGETTDHPHHRSLWFTHGDVNGVDFWTEGKNRGRIEFEERLDADASGSEAAIVTRNRWVGPDGKIHLRDTRRIAFYATEDARVIDYDVTLTAPDRPTKLGDTKEGTFGLRVRGDLDVDKKSGGKIVTSEGKTNEAAWGTRAAWCDYSGLIDGEKVGVCVMNHPSSFRYPTPWMVRTYGLFAANPFGLKSFDPNAKEDGAHTIAPGESLTLRYRVVFHKGDAADANLDEAFKAYSASEPSKTK